MIFISDCMYYTYFIITSMINLSMLYNVEKSRLHNYVCITDFICNFNLHGFK